MADENLEREKKIRLHPSYNFISMIKRHINKKGHAFGPATHHSLSLFLYNPN